MKDDKIKNTGLYRLELFKWMATCSLRLKDPEMDKTKAHLACGNLTGEEANDMYSLHEAIETMCDDVSFSTVFEQEIRIDYTDDLIERIYALTGLDTEKALSTIHIIQHNLGIFKKPIIDLLIQLDCLEILEVFLKNMKIVEDFINEEKDELLNDVNINLERL